MTLWAAPARAQTLFAWPDTAVDVSRYTTVDECVAAAGRVSGTLAGLDSLVPGRDTLPWNPHASLDPAPAAVTATAVRCGAKFTAAAAPLDEYQRYLELFLAANRDSDAAVLAQRRLAALASETGSGSEERSVVDSIVKIYMNARPARLAAAESLLERRVRGTGDMVPRLLVYQKMVEQAELANDTALVHRLALQVLAAADSVTPADTGTEEAQHLLPPLGIRAFQYNAVVFLMGDQVRMDSLAHGGAAALASLERSWWHQYTGGRGMGFIPSAIGELAPVIRARFWFPDSAAAMTLPAPGKVSLVAFMPEKWCGHEAVDAEPELFGDKCNGSFAVLRRLAARFPALQIIVVTHTQGYFSYAVMRSAAEEAGWIRKWIATSAPPGIILAVDSTSSWHLPAPDSRRIDRPVPADSAYTIGQSANTGIGFEVPVFFLVDQDRRIAGNWQLTTYQEQKVLVPEIEALLRRAPRP